MLPATHHHTLDLALLLIPWPRSHFVDLSSHLVEHLHPLLSAARFSWVALRNLNGALTLAIDLLLDLLALVVVYFFLSSASSFTFVL